MHKSVKILITTDLYKPLINGVVTSILNLQRGLERLGHEVRILALSQDIHSKQEKGVYYIGSLSTELIYPGTRICLEMPNRFLNDIVSWKPDIVHSQSEIVTFGFAKRIAKTCNAPLIHTYHTNYEEYTHYFCPIKSLGHYIISHTSRRVFKGVDRIIVPSLKMEKILNQYKVPTKVVVIPSGVDYDSFSTSPNRLWLKNKKTELGFGNNTLTLIYVGRLAKEKNVFELIELMRTCKNLPVKLLIVGDGPTRSELEKKCRKLKLKNKVTFVGMISPTEVWKYYHLGDVFVNASTSEAQGLTNIEALASGLPLICKKDECLDSIIKDSVNGWQYQKPSEFRQHIEELIYNDELRIKMSMSSISESQAYSFTGIAKRVEDVYFHYLGLIIEDRAKGTPFEGVQIKGLTIEATPQYQE